MHDDTDSLLVHQHKLINQINVLLFLIVLFYSANMNASWAPLDEAELFQRSDLIVQATVIEIRGNPQLPQNLYAAQLKIESSYKGQEDNLFVLTPAPTSLRVSDQIFLEEGQAGFWFLTQSKIYPHFYLLNHPQRFWPLSQRAQFHKALKIYLNPEE